MKHKEDGFTLVELLIALAVFSFLLMTVTVGFVQIMRQYQNGLASRRTQQNARFLIEDMTRTARNANLIRVASSGDSNHEVVCFEYDNTSIRYRITSIGQISRSQVDSGTCPATGPGGNAEDVLESGVLATILRIDGLNGNPPSGYISGEITIKISSDTVDLLTAEGDCDPTQRGAHFCAATELSTIVTTRGGD